MFRSWCSELFAFCKKFGKSKQRRRAKSRRPARRALSLEPLEARELLTGAWFTMEHDSPNSGGLGNMVLLSDGTVMAQGGQFDGSGTSSTWYKLTPDSSGSYNPLVTNPWSNLPSMSLQRRYFTSNVLPDGRVFVMGGEYTGPTGAQNTTNTGEIFDPTANSGQGKWTSITPLTLQGQSTFFKVFGYHFGDDPTEVVRNSSGQYVVLCGYINGPQTYFYNPAADPLLNPSLPSTSNPWSAAQTKLSRVVGGTTYFDPSDEESWVKLADGSILSYDVYTSQNTNTFYAERYIPSTNQWVDASTPSKTNPPALLSGANVGSELGPAFLLPNGDAIFFGGNGNTAIYSNGVWSAGPTMPADANGNQLVAADAPGAMLPNGKILLALTPIGTLSSTGAYQWPNSTTVEEFDPNATTPAQQYIPVNPPAYNAQSKDGYFMNWPSFEMTMLVLPTGQVLLSNGTTQDGTTNTKATLELYQYNYNGDDGAPAVSWQPTVTDITHNADGTFTLTGTQLNGISEGAAYGDDAEMSSNFPIVQFQNIFGDPFFARTFNWSSSGVQTGSTPETTQFTGGFGAGAYLVQSIANGIASNGVLDILTDAAHSNITLQLDPADSSQYQIWSNGSLWSEWPITFSRIIVSGTTAETVNINSTPSGVPVTVDSAARVNVGQGGSVGGINSDVNIENPPSRTTVNVDDSADRGRHTVTMGTFTPTGDSAWGYISGLAVGHINYEYADTTSVTVSTGINTGNLINVYATAVPINLMGHASDTVTIGNNGDLSGVLGAVTVKNSAYTTLNIDDSNDATNKGRTVTLDSANNGDPLLDAVSFSGLAAIYYRTVDLNALNISGDALGNDFEVIQTPAGYTTTLNTGLGDDTVNVRSTLGSLAINGQDGQDSVTLGNIATGVQDILGHVMVTNQNSFTALTVDDAADSTAQPDFSKRFSGVTTVSISASQITGLAPANISYNASDLRSLLIKGGSGGNTFTVADTPDNGLDPSDPDYLTTTLRTGTGNDTVTVQATTGPLVLDDTAGSDTFTIGNAGNVQSILGNITIPAPFYKGILSDSIDLTVDDSADPNPQPDPARGLSAVTVSASAITGLAPATISYSQYDLRALTIQGGSGGNRFTVTGTPFSLVALGMTTLLDTGTGNDAVTVQATSGPLFIQGQSGHDSVTIGNNGKVENILGDVTVHNTGSYTDLTVDDSADTAPQPGNAFIPNQALTVDDAAITGLAPGVIRYQQNDLSSLAIDGGPGGDTFTVLNTPDNGNSASPAVTTLNLGSGTNTVVVQGTTGPLTVNGSGTVNVGSAANSLDPIQGAVTVNGQGGNTTLNIYDEGTPGSQRSEYDVYADHVVRIPPGQPQGSPTQTVNYFNVGHVHVYGAASAAIWYANSTLARTTTDLISGNSLPAGLVSLWKGDGSANDFLDRNNGTLPTGVTFAPGVTGATGDQAFSFNGSNALVDVGHDPSLNISGSLTVSAWVNVQSLDHAKYLFADFDSSGHLSQGSLGILPTGQFFWFQGNERATNGFVEPSGATHANLNQWYHVAVVRDDNAKTVTLYVNGVQDGSVSYAGIPVLALQGDKLLGGAGPGFPRDSFNGLLDDVGFFNRALSAAEIQNIYSSGAFGGGGSVSNQNEFLVGSPDGIQGPLTVHGNSYDFAVAQDGSNAVGHTYTLTTGELQRDGMANLTYDGLGKFALYDPNYLGHTPNTNTINVQSIGNISAIIGAGTGDTVTVGQNGTMNNILGALSITGTGLKQVTLDDSGNSTAYNPPRTITLGSDPSLGYLVSGLAEGGGRIGLGLDPTTPVAIRTGSGNDLFRVHDLVGVPALAIDGGGGSNTLQGPDTTNTWQISGADAGTLDRLLHFSSVQNLLGGAAGDTFAFQNGGSLSGKIDGGGGTNALDYSTYQGDILVDLLLNNANNASLVGQGVFNMANVTGSQGNNLIVGDAATTALVGGTARNVLIGGGGTETITGGGGYNLLIGGKTAYDTNLAALQALMQYWDNPNVPNTGALDSLVNPLKSKKNGVNVNGLVLMLNSTTVQDDNAADSLIGGSGANWFIKDREDTINNGAGPGPNDRQTVI